MYEFTSRRATGSAQCDGRHSHLCTSLAQYDTRLQAVPERLSTAGVTLNSSKCEFSKNQLIFLSHVITQSVVSADPSKTEAINQMKIPKSVSELRRFLGIINQLGKFPPRIAHFSQPL